jgi:hypothetical protein
MKTLKLSGLFMALAAIGLASAPVAQAQVEEFDPSRAINTDYKAPEFPEASTAVPAATANTPPSEAGWDDPYAPVGDSTTDPTGSGTANAPSGQTPANTYQKDDLIGAAEGVFGEGAEGVAGLLEDILKKQGQPNGYIVGREGGGAFIVGLRYGSGTMYHKVEGQRPVYWTGPSIGIDAGAQAGSSFILVYNLYDTERLFTKRFVAGEGAAYAIGGLHVSYLRKGDIVLIPVRMGLGLRLGANVGYMKFSKKQRWLPF